MRRDALGVVESLLLLVAVVGLLATAGGALQRAFGVAGIGLTEIVVVLAPTLGAAWAFRVAPSGLGLRRPPPRALFGGLLAGAGGFYLVAAGIEAGMERVAPLPPEVREQMRRLIVPASGPRPLAVDLLVLVLAPAACEELLFRGALLESWRRAGPLAAVGASALAFGFFHLDAYKLVPTAALGAIGGALAWRARSALPAMAMHAVNNAAVVLLVRAGHDEPPPVGSPGGVALLAGALAALAAGIALAGPIREKRVNQHNR